MTGVLAVDKPEGPTSHDVVARVRRALRIRRIGHTGTLDPFASGLLLLCVGPATRLAEYFSDLPKSYEGTARLGVVTDTLDRTGQVVAEREVDDLPAERIRAAFEGQVGRRLQTPPAYSAKKLAGRRAYELARAGVDVKPAAVEVEILELEVLAVTGAEVRFRTRCSSGTYVRAIARDAGETLGCGAHLATLRRTAIGGLSVDAAVPPDGLSDAAVLGEALIDPLQALAHLPVVHLESADAAAVRHGRAVRMVGAPEGTVALAEAGSLVAVAESAGGVIRPRKVLA